MRATVDNTTVVSVRWEYPAYRVRVVLDGFKGRKAINLTWQDLNGLIPPTWFDTVLAAYDEEPEPPASRLLGIQSR